MGFSHLWIEWITRCVPRGNITPVRKLRKGDLLSPYIFILCMEALVSLLNHAENQDNITGMCVSHTSPPVSYLIVVDDSLFFCQADPCECDEAMKALETYGIASSQCINFEKSFSLW